MISLTITITITKNIINYNYNYNENNNNENSSLFSLIQKIKIGSAIWTIRHKCERKNAIFLLCNLSVTLETRVFMKLNAPMHASRAFKALSKLRNSVLIRTILLIAL